MTEQSLNNQADQLISAAKKAEVRDVMLCAEEEAYEYNKTFFTDRYWQSIQPGFDLKAYVQCNRHRQGLPYLNVTTRQLDVLMRYVPGPLGLGMDVKAIARDMKIGRTSLWRIMSELKEKHPKAMEQVETMRRVMFRQGDNIYQQTRSLEGMCAAVDEGGVQDEMVDRF
jgi:hypothetical protein